MRPTSACTRSPCGRRKFCLNFCRIGAKPGILDRRIEGAAQEDGPLRSKSRRTSKWTRDGGRSGKKFEQLTIFRLGDEIHDGRHIREFRICR